MRAHNFGLSLFFLAGLCTACSSRGGVVSPAAIETTVGPCAAKWDMGQVYQPNEIISAGGQNWQARQTTKRDVPEISRLGRRVRSAWVPMGKCSDPSAPSETGSPGSSGGVGGPAVGADFALTPYKDVTVAFNYMTNVMATEVTGTTTPVLSVDASLPGMTWAFATGECGQETWAGIDANMLVSANLALWEAAKKPYIISTGGAGGTFTCGSDAGFFTFLDRYLSPMMIGVDFDIEAGQSSEQINSLVARVKAAQANDKYKNLRFSFTLATLGGNTPQSLSETGASVVKAIQSANLSSYLINLMVMDFGSANASNCTLGASKLCDMGQSAVQAAKNLQMAYNIPYKNIELTPMIGGNDTVDEIFSLADVTTMMTFVREQGLAGVHWWSLDRDTDCKGSDTATSSVCAGANKAAPLGYLKAFVAALK